MGPGSSSTGTSCPGMDRDSYIVTDWWSIWSMAWRILVGKRRPPRVSMTTRTCLLVLGWVSNTGRSPRNTAARDTDTGSRPIVAGWATHDYTASRRSMVVVVVDDEPAAEVYQSASWAVVSGTLGRVVFVREGEEYSAWLQCHSRVLSGRRCFWPRPSTHPRPAR